MDISFEKYLYENEDNLRFNVNYYLFPKRWENIVIDNHILNELNWSNEIKYLNDNGTDVSDAINALPQNTGVLTPQ